MHQLLPHVLKRFVHQLRPNQHQHLVSKVIALHSYHLVVILMEKIIVQMGIVHLITIQIVQK